MQKVTIGIDPGLTGAICVICGEHISLYTMPTFGTKPRLVDVEAVLKITGTADGQLNGSRVVIERQQPMRKKGVIQGVTSAFTTGENYGRLCGALEAVGWPVHEVRASQWKRHAGLWGKTKKDSLALAKRRHPELAGELRLVKDEGKAEALLIAEYGQESVTTTW